MNISLLSSEHPLVKKSKSAEGPNSTLYFDMYSREMLIQVCCVLTLYCFDLLSANTAYLFLQPETPKANCERSYSYCV